MVMVNISQLVCDHEKNAFYVRGLSVFPRRTLDH